MALKPELIKRRKRISLPRAPLRPLREQVKELGSADEKLELLLEELIVLAERETLFTSTLEHYRLLSALSYGGYVFTVMINVENQIAPGATVTTYLPVLSGFTYIPDSFEYLSSLPWWLSAAVWADSDLPAPPASFFVRAPERFLVEWESIFGLHRFLRYTITNNHAVNTAYFLASHAFAVATDDTFKMIEDIYVKPLVDYIRENAEKLTGRPWP